jgi:uncharacterized protein YdeI (YjbR/CyaY-like superfamily)
MDITETLYVTDRAQWRAWLETHHDNAKEIWLVYPKKSSGKARIVYNDAVEEALCFGWIDSNVKGVDADHSAQRFSPRKVTSGYSQANIERLRKLSAEHALLPTFEAQVKPVLAAPFVFPPDIMKAIKADPKAWENYQKFSPTYQRIRVAFIEGARNRPEEFTKRLSHFLKTAEQNRQIGFGGIEAYY